MGCGDMSKRAGQVGRSALLAVLLASTSAGAGLLVTAQPARAQAGQVAFDIPAGPLSQALATFGRQAGIQVTYASALASGKTSVGVSGSTTADAALARILEGTGLTFSFVGAGTVAIEAPGGATVSEDGSIILEEIDVTAWVDNAASGSGFQGTPDWVYETPGSVSVVSREAIQSKSVRNARELLADTPGVLVSGDNNQNQGVNVNIRGLQDQGRVNMMIDGARQNFQRSGHGSTSYAYVDPALIRAVEVEKDGTSGVGGAGVLAGSVNFRTLVAEDLIQDGKNAGLEVELTGGSNAHDFTGSAAGAVRFSDSFALVGGFSHKTLGEYAIGQNGEVSSEWEQLGLEAPVFTGSDTWSGLLKAEIRPSTELSIDLSWMRYDSLFSQGASEETSGGTSREDTQDVTNDTLVAAVGWDPDDELIDLKARLWFNRTLDEEHKAQRTEDVQAVDVDYSMATFGGSIENTSRFALPVGELALNYGVEAFHDTGVTTATGAGVDAEPLTALWYAGATPSGQRDVVSTFANATLEHDDWLSLSGGLRSDWYRLGGSPTVIGETVAIYHPPQNCVRYYSDGVTCRVWGTKAYYTYEHPSEEVDVNISDGALLPSAKVAVEPWEGVQLFGSYSQAFRPPTVMEAFVSGAHVGAIGPGYAPNASLEAESGSTYEIGLNYLGDDVFAAGDHVRGKIVGFHREIDNYIAMGKVGLNDVDYVSYVNLDGMTRMTGLEVEASYDAGAYYVGGAFSYIDTDYASTFTYEGTSYNTEQYIIFTVPAMKVSLDAGVRLLEEKLTLGGRVTHVEPHTQATGLYPSLLSGYASEGYTTLDLYGSYALSDFATLRLAVNNVTDLAYVPVLGSQTLPAPGRTATVSLNLKF